MAIRLLQSSIVANYDVSPNAGFYQGDPLVFDSAPTGAITGVQPVKGATQNPALALLAGFSTSDHNVTGNTLIQNDPVGSSIVSANGSTFTDYSNGFYVGPARRIGDFQDETVNTVTNLTDISATGLGTPKRGVGVVRQHGTQFVTDRFDTVTATYTNGLALGINVQLNGTGAYVTSVSGANQPTRCDYYDSTAGLLYVTIIA